ncbi:MAG: ABC transporter permease subunit, partial [Acidimicrobiales bacterium]
RVRAVAYLASGLLGGVAGIMLLGLLGQGQVDAGDPYLLECVAAALIAYAFLGMKRPSVHGTVFGSLFVAVVVNGLTMFNVPYYAEDMTYGLLLIVALVLTYSLGGGVTASSAGGRRRQLLRLPGRDSTLQKVAPGVSTSVDGVDWRNPTDGEPRERVPSSGLHTTTGDNSYHE